MPLTSVLTGVRSPSVSSDSQSVRVRVDTGVPCASSGAVSGGWINFGGSLDGSTHRWPNSLHR